MAHDSMEKGAAIAAGGGTITDDGLDLLHCVTAAAAIDAVAGGRRGRFHGGSLAPFTPCDGPIEHLVDVHELPNCGIQRVAGHCERLIGAPEQLGCDQLAVDL